MLHSYLSVLSRSLQFPHLPTTSFATCSVESWVVNITYWQLVSEDHGSDCLGSSCPRGPVDSLSGAELTSRQMLHLTGNVGVSGTESTGPDFVGDERNTCSISRGVASPVPENTRGLNGWIVVEAGNYWLGGGCCCRNDNQSSNSCTGKIQKSRSKIYMNRSVSSSSKGYRKSDSLSGNRCINCYSGN